MNNDLRKHREGRAGFTLDPTTTAGSSCAAAAGLEHDFTALPNPSFPHPFLPRNSQESIPDPTCHLGFSLLLVLNCSIELFLLQTQILGSWFKFDTPQHGLVSFTPYSYSAHSASIDNLTPTRCPGFPASHFVLFQGPTKAPWTCWQVLWDSLRAAGSSFGAPKPPCRTFQKH